MRGLGIFGLRISTRKVAQYCLHALNGWVRLGGDFITIEIIGLFYDFLIVGLEIFSQDSQAKILVGLISVYSLDHRLDKSSSGLGAFLDDVSSCGDDRILKLNAQ